MECLAAASVLLSVGKRYLAASAAAAGLTAQTGPAAATIQVDSRPSGSRVCALVLVLGVIAVFGVALSQSYGPLLLWARDDADRILWGHKVPPDFFAALPAGFVLLFGPLLEQFLRVLMARGRTPSESGKFTAGMLLCALAYGLMLTVSLAHHEPSLASPVWLVACQVAMALGELLGVPVGLSLAEALAQPRSKGLTLGLSYGAHALGYWLGGAVSAQWPVWSHAQFFGGLALGSIVAAALIQSQAQRFARAFPATS